MTLGDWTLPRHMQPWNVRTDELTAEGIMHDDELTAEGIMHDEELTAEGIMHDGARGKAAHHGTRPHIRQDRRHLASCVLPAKECAQVVGTGHHHTCPEKRDDWWGGFHQVLAGVKVFPE